MVEDVDGVLEKHDRARIETLEGFYERVRFVVDKIGEPRK